MRYIFCILVTISTIYYIICKRPLIFQLFLVNLCSLNCFTVFHTVGYFFRMSVYIKSLLNSGNYSLFRLTKETQRKIGFWTTAKTPVWDLKQFQPQKNTIFLLTYITAKCQHTALQLFCVNESASYLEKKHLKSETLNSFYAFIMAWVLGTVDHTLHWMER